MMGNSGRTDYLAKGRYIDTELQGGLLPLFVIRGIKDHLVITG